MLNNIVNNNLNENKSINISNIYDEVNLNINSSNMNKYINIVNIFYEYIYI
jgi:hypothetical protein